jgi:hypothetical protein
VTKIKQSASSKESQSIPPAICSKLPKSILSYAKKHFAGQFTHIDIYFRGALCYIDAYCDPAVRSEDLSRLDSDEYRKTLKMHEDKVTHLCRLRYLGSSGKWGFDFYNYSNERYQPSVFPTGLPTGTPEEAFDLTASLYL